MRLPTIATEADESHRFYRLRTLPNRDPFDLMVAWQAVRRHLVLVARDSALPGYREAGLPAL